MRPNIVSINRGVELVAQLPHSLRNVAAVGASVLSLAASEQLVMPAVGYADGCTTTQEGNTTTTTCTQTNEDGSVTTTTQKTTNNSGPSSSSPETSNGATPEAAPVTPSPTPTTVPEPTESRPKPARSEPRAKRKPSRRQNAPSMKRSFSGYNMGASPFTDGNGCFITASASALRRVTGDQNITPRSLYRGKIRTNGVPKEVLLGVNFV